MKCIEITHLYKTFNHQGYQVDVLQDLCLQIEQNSFTVIVGHSGCGKTTLLRIIAQLEIPDSGEIKFHLEYPHIGFVFQEARLMPWLTVQENVGFLQTKTDSQQVDQLLTLLNLQEYAQFYPHQISGGMAQKTALGRALAYQSQIILMDEPFAALDYFTRGYLQKELLRIFQTLSKTVIFVTHNIDEAILLGDRIVILNQGKTADVLINSTDPKEREQADYQINVKKKIIQNLKKIN